jgi:hypothetical protein
VAAAAAAAAGAPLPASVLTRLILSLRPFLSRKKKKEKR